MAAPPDPARGLSGAAAERRADIKGGLARDRTRRTRRRPRGGPGDRTSPRGPGPAAAGRASGPPIRVRAGARAVPAPPKTTRRSRAQDRRVTPRPPASDRSAAPASATGAPVRNRALRMARIASRGRIRRHGARTRPARRDDRIPAVAGGIRLPFDDGVPTLGLAGHGSPLSESRTRHEDSQTASQTALHHGVSSGPRRRPEQAISGVRLRSRWDHFIF